MNVEERYVDSTLVFVQFFHGKVSYQASAEQKECVNTNHSIVNDLKEVVFYCKIEELEKVVDLGGSFKVHHPVANHDPCDGKGSDSQKYSSIFQVKTRVDMSKALHSAYTLHGKTLTHLHSSKIE